MHPLLLLPQQSFVLFACLLSMIFFPVMIQSIQRERADGNVVAMQLQSLKLRNYWMATYLWNQMLYWFIMIIFYVAAIAAGVEWVKYCRHGSLLFTFLLWGHAEVSLAIFLAALFGKLAPLYLPRAGP